MDDAPARKLNRQSALPLATRGAALFALLCLELLSFHAPIDLAGRPRSSTVPAQDIVDALTFASGSVLVAFSAFILACWPQKQLLYEAWAKTARDHPWRRWAALSAIAATIVFALTMALKLGGGAQSAPLGLLVGGWALGIGLVLGAMALAAAPLAFWRELGRTRPVELLIALAAVAGIWALAVASQNSWHLLAGATFEVSRWVLQQYEPVVHVDAARRFLGVDQFWVEISAECSGFEGIGLVTGFLILYVAAFRRQLKFPNILLILPIGIALIWTLNAVRIAALVEIGAHISSQLAMHGFHSVAGWLLFLAVTLGIMLTAHRIPFLRADDFRPERSSDPAVTLASALLLPVIVLLLGNFVASAFSSTNQWFYAIPVVAVCAVLFAYRDTYRNFIQPVSWLSVAVGVGIGVVWVLTDRSLHSTGAIDAWVGSLAPSGAAAWLAMRIFGLVILVPIAEEIAFRGYIHRALISRRFETVALDKFTWVAFLGSTLVFALMHTRWLSAFLAGALYALLMYRSNRLSDPIAAHASSNAVIAVAAVWTKHWALL